MTRRTRPTGLAMGSVLALTVSQAAATTAPALSWAAAAPAASTYRMYVTFYGALDNDPPGSSEIAYPAIHSHAGGTGTYADPVTFATDRAELPPGTRVYYPYLKKYFVIEDECAQCGQEWSGHGPNAGPHRRHIDLWAGDSTNSAILTCEDSLTRGGLVPVVVNPSPDRLVDTTAIFDSATLTCYTTALQAHRDTARLTPQHDVPDGPGRVTASGQRDNGAVRTRPEPRRP